MLRSLLMGLAAGQRAMTPLAALTYAARRGTLADAAPGRRLLAHPLVTAGAIGLAAAEMAGDKMATAPDRTVLPGLVARTLTAGFAGAVLAPSRRPLGALLAVAAALASAPLGLDLRLAAMRRAGQVPTGIVEDAAVFGLAMAVASS